MCGGRWARHAIAHRRVIATSADMLVQGLKDLYEIAQPEGAFYVFPKVPASSGAVTASEFVERAIENQLLRHPGKNLQQPDTHFRIFLRRPRQNHRARHRSTAKISKTLSRYSYCNGAVMEFT